MSSSSSSGNDPNNMNSYSSNNNNNNNAVILIYDSSLRDLYSTLGVEELTAATAVKKFTIPALLDMEPWSRIIVMIELSKKWDQYRGDPSLVQQLKEIPFIPLWDYSKTQDNDTDDLGSVQINNISYLNRSVDLRRANDLFLWTNHDLLEALNGKEIAKYYPPPYLRSNSLCSVFIDLGMLTELNEESFKNIINDIEHDASIATACNDYTFLHETCDRGRKILRYLKQNDRFSTLLQNINFAKSLGKIRFVPMQFPENISTGGYITYRKDIGRFDQLLSIQHGSLAFTVMPILDEDISPPQYYFSFLGITNSPKIEIILKHIRNLTTIGESLDRWNSTYTIIHTFNSIFHYLNDHVRKIGKY